MNQTAKKGEESALFECKNLSVNLVSLFALHLMHCPVKALTFLQGCQRKKKEKAEFGHLLLLLKFSTEKNQTALQSCWWCSRKGKCQYIYNKSKYM